MGVLKAVGPIPFIVPTLTEKLFQCHCCKQVPKGFKFYYCSENGHQWCVGCAELVLQECTICIEGKDKNTNNIESKLQKCSIVFLDYLYSNTKFYCENQGAGCKLTPTGAQYEEHVQNCEFRPHNNNQQGK